MRNIFTEHPKKVNETYFQHLKFALCYSKDLFVASASCFIHAFFPFLFEYTASKKICLIVDKLKKSGRWELLKQKFGCE